jgi:hypothetical protein
MELDYVIQVAEFESEYAVLAQCSAVRVLYSIKYVYKTCCDASWFIALQKLYSIKKLYNIRNTELFIADE